LAASTRLVVIPLTTHITHHTHHSQDTDYIHTIYTTHTTYTPHITCTTQGGRTAAEGLRSCLAPSEVQIPSLGRPSPLCFRAPVFETPDFPAVCLAFASAGKRCNTPKNCRFPKNRRINALIRLFFGNRQFFGGLRRFTRACICSADRGYFRRPIDWDTETEEKCRPRDGILRATRSFRLGTSGGAQQRREAPPPPHALSHTHTFSHTHTNMHMLYTIIYTI